jgi:aspartyl-tRNA(Asn)/glutamyl-tRNA(Gln) amidotransferase subunit C
MKDDGRRVEEITPEIFEHLVLLAAFELNDEETEYLREELNGQLKAVRELEAIEVDSDIPITSHGVPYDPSIRPALREDVIRPCEEAEEILAQAPEVRDRFIVVPDIPHTELE